MGNVVNSFEFSILSIGGEWGERRGVVSLYLLLSSLPSTWLISYLEVGAMRHFYREKKYICGDYMDIQIFPVYPTARSRGKRKKPTSDVQAKLNAENAKKKLLRLVHTNFTWKDYELTFTYKDKYRPDDEETAKKHIQNFFRRAKRLYKRNGIDLKYIWVMERAEQTGKIHFHAFLSGGVDRTAIEELWGFGYANSQALKFDENGVAGLVYYDLKDKPLTYRRWSCSKNLKKPEERQNDSRVTFARAKKLYDEAENVTSFMDTYPEYAKTLGDYIVSDVSALHNEFNGDYYFSIRLRKRAAKIL